MKCEQKYDVRADNQTLVVYLHIYYLKDCDYDKAFNNEVTFKWLDCLYVRLYWFADHSGPFEIQDACFFLIDYINLFNREYKYGIVLI